MPLLIAALIAAAQPAQDPRFEPLRRRIDEYCQHGRACILEQRRSARHFLGMLTLFRPPQRVAAQCLSGSTRGRMTNWVEAARCLRTWSRSRRR
jgi:hypothetical protein